MTKLEDSSYLTPKITASFWKVPPKIFVNPGQYPCKSVKRKNDITFSKINISIHNMDRRYILKITFDLKKFLTFPDFPRKMTFWEIKGQNSLVGHTILKSYYMGLQSTTT